MRQESRFVPRIRLLLAVSLLTGSLALYLFSLARAETGDEVARAEEAPSLAALDIFVIVAYAVGLLAVGWYFSLKTRSSTDYFLGGRRMRPLAVGLSLFATLMSAISYLAQPGEMIKHGPIVFAGILSFPLIVLIVGWFLIPSIMKSEVTTAYELLEKKLGVNVRVFASSLFLCLRLIWMSVIIYLLAEKIVVPVLGLEDHGSAAIWVSAAVGLVTVIYTSMGGLRAVVFTDVVQTLILFGGLLLTILLITIRMGGIGAWWPTEWADSWDSLRILYDPGNPEARTILGAFLATLTWHICTTGSDQVAIQRYLATRNAKAARRVLVTSVSADMTVMMFLGMLGLALLAYFQSNPSELPPGKSLVESADGLFIRFIVTALPAGITGLVIAGLLAAAMSSLSSGVNSVSSVITVDFVERFRSQKLSEAGKVRLAKYISLGIGAVIVFLSTMVDKVGDEDNLMALGHKTVNALVAPLFVPFFMAIFIPWATSTGTMVGMLASVAWAGAVSFEVVDLNFLWLMPSALVVGITVATVSSLMPVGGTRGKVGGRSPR